MYASVDVSVLVCVYVKQHVCVRVCLQIPDFCTGLKGYDIQKSFIKVIKQAFIGGGQVPVNVCMNTSPFMCACIYTCPCFVYVLCNTGRRSSEGWILYASLWSVRKYWWCQPIEDNVWCMLCFLRQYLHWHTSIKLYLNKKKMWRISYSLLFAVCVFVCVLAHVCVGPTVWIRFLLWI